MIIIIMVITYTHMVSICANAQHSSFVGKKVAPHESDSAYGLRREQGYWVSYNSPFFKEIREVSGADDMEKRFGDAYSYTRNPRAKIFQRDTIHATEAQV